MHKPKSFDGLEMRNSYENQYYRLIIRHLSWSNRRDKTLEGALDFAHNQNAYTMEHDNA